METIKSRRWIRRTLWLLGSVCAFWLLAWLVVPSVARSQIEKHASQALGRAVTVSKVEFLPWTLEATVHDLAIASQDGQGSQVKIARIYIDAALQSLWRLGPVIDALEVDAPVLRITQTAPGHYDFDDILARLAQEPPKEDASPLRFALYNIALQGGSVEFDDRTVDKVHLLRDVRLDVPFLSSLSAAREVKVTPRLAFELNGTAFDTAAQMTPFTTDRKTEARLQFKDFDVKPFAGYLPHSVPVRLKAGVLNADLTLGFEQESTPQVKISGRVDLQGVQTTDAADARLLDFDALHIVLKDVRPLQRVVEIDTVDWRGAHVQLRRDATGTVVIPGQAPAKAAPLEKPAKEVKPAAKAMGAAPEAPWQIKLGQLRLREATVDWRDASLPGGEAAWKAQQLQLDASALALPFQQPLQFHASAQLSGGGAQGFAGQIAIQGQASDTLADAAVTIRGLPVAMAQPYLAGVLRPGLSGSLDADLGVARRGQTLVAKVATLSLDKAALHCAVGAPCQDLRRAGMADASKNTLLELGRVEVANVTARLPHNQLSVGQLSLKQPRVQVSRSAKGEWMFDEWLAPAPATRPAAPPPAGAPGKPWAIQVAGLAVEGGSLAFRDAAAAQPVALNLSTLQLRVKEFSFANGRMAPVAVQLDTRVAAGRVEPGRLSYDGSVAMAPALSTQGKVRAQHLPLHALEPYVAPDLNVDILRADGSFAGDVRYAQEKAGPRVSVKGDLSLDEVRVRAAEVEAAGPQAERAVSVAERGEELLRWKSLGLRGVDVSLEPGKPLVLDVRETALSDFFARIIVQESGRINLQDIRKAAAAEQDAAVAQNQAAPSADASPSAAQADPMAPVIRFGPVALTNGAVRFTDNFIKPHYSVDVSDLAGRLSAFSSLPPAAGAEPQMADLTLKGRAQGTASLEVTGKLNPLAKPLALDIQGSMRDLELPPLSPYSIKYAGHGIERGKLRMDVSYKVLPNGQLTASNRLVLNQLAFGDPVEGAPASLPVRLAVALLADRNGVIDVDLPISGSLNDPEFRLGAVIFRIIGNLIMKAVTAPFSLLASAFGSADQQGVVPFAAGSAELDDKARQLLDKLAQQLVDRPALKLTVVGWAHPQAEQEAWKRLHLRDLAQAQKRRAVAAKGESAADLPPVTDEEYPALLKEAYQRADIKKPRNLVGLAKDLPQAEMEALLLKSIDVPANAMADLALKRGVATRDYLAGRQVPLERLFVGASKLQPAGDAGAAWEPKAELVLGMQ